MARRIFPIMAAVAASAILAPGLAHASEPWDGNGFALDPGARLSSVFHATGMPDTLKLCAPVGKQCPAVRTLSEFRRGTVFTTEFQPGADIVAVGPFRFGLDADFAWGTGPSSRIGPAEFLPGSWLRTAGELVFGLRLRRGVVRGWLEVTPGFMNLETNVQGPDPSGKELTAIGTTWVLGGRAGLGVAVRPWLTASAFLGAAIGSFVDRSGGFRLDFHWASPPSP